MPLETLDFTGVSEGYRENRKPEKLGIYTFICAKPVHFCLVKKESPKKYIVEE